MCLLQVTTIVQLLIQINEPRGIPSLGLIAWLWILDVNKGKICLFHTNFCVTGSLLSSVNCKWAVWNYFSFALKDSTESNEGGNEADDTMGIIIIMSRLLTVVTASVLVTVLEIPTLF